MTAMVRVFLSGPIDGLPLDVASSWRQRASARFAEVGVDTYDPTQVSYGKLLQIFFAVVQDPTELDRQGPDVGPSYRSVIFAQDDTQQKIANAYIAQLNAAGSFPAPIVTAVAPQAPFFPAEAYHQNFFDLHANNPYIVANDLPKLGELKSTFPDLYRD